MNLTKTRPIVAGCTVAIAVLAGCLTASPASAHASIATGDVAAMRTTWDRYGVPTTTQDRLLDALSDGRIWDSLTGAAPVGTSERVVAGSTVTVDTFADGSIRVTTVEQPVDPSSRASIGGCRTMSGSHYDSTIQCTVSTNVVVSTAGYAVTYHQVQGGASSINSVTGITATCYGGTCGSKSVAINRKTQSGNSPAYSTGRWKWTAVNGVGSKDFWLEFDVRGTTTWASNN
jgi:hypothetical protein